MKCSLSNYYIGMVCYFKTIHQTLSYHTIILGEPLEHIRYNTLILQVRKLRGGRVGQCPSKVTLRGSRADTLCLLAALCSHFILASLLQLRGACRLLRVMKMHFKAHKKLNNEKQSLELCFHL